MQATNIKVYNHPIGKFKYIKYILDILTALTLLIGLIITSNLSNTYDPMTSMESLYYSVKNLWIFYLFLPVSICDIIYGLYLKSKGYKYKSSVFLGTFFSIFLLLYGSMFLLNTTEFNDDKSYLANLEEKMDIDFNDDFTILTNEISDSTTSSESVIIKSVSNVRFNSDNVLDDKWLNEINDNGYIPKVFLTETKDYGNYIVYCFNDDVYNPLSFEKDKDYVVMAYEKENNYLIIYEYIVK